MDDCPQICNGCENRSQNIERINNSIESVFSCDNCDEPIKVGEYFWHMESCGLYFCNKCSENVNYHKYKSDTNLNTEGE